MMAIQINMFGAVPSAGAGGEPPGAGLDSAIAAGAQAAEDKNNPFKRIFFMALPLLLNPASNGRTFGQS